VNLRKLPSWIQLMETEIVHAVINHWDSWALRVTSCETLIRKFIINVKITME
jgi:hypothetical protein